MLLKLVVETLAQTTLLEQLEVAEVAVAVQPKPGIGNKLEGEAVVEVDKYGYQQHLMFRLIRVTMAIALTLSVTATKTQHHTTCFTAIL